MYTNVLLIPAFWKRYRTTIIDALFDDYLSMHFYRRTFNNSVIKICKVVQAKGENKALLISAGVTKIDGENFVPGEDKAPMVSMECRRVICSAILGTRAIDGLAAAEKAVNMRVIVSVRQEEGPLGVAPLGSAVPGKRR